MLTLAIFAVLVLLMFLGIPVALSMALTAMLFFVGLGEMQNLTMVAQRMYSSTTGFTLLAIPFFIMAGNLMNTGGVTTRIFRFASAMCGHLWGGLAQVVIFAAVIMSGMTGAAVAEAAGLGMLSMKALPERGFGRAFTAAITGAAATIGPVIPPSIPFVIYGTLTGVSVAQLFVAGFVPGIMMAVAMGIAVYFISKARNYPRQTRASLKEVAASFADSILAILTPVIIIGGILSGVFTPTEASVVACVYALILGMFVYKEVKLTDLPRILWETVLNTIRIMYIISVAGFFGWFLIYQRIPEQVITELSALSSNPNVIMAIFIFVLLVLGCFMEGIAILVITIPVFLPITTQYGIDPVQFGVVMILCSMIGLLTPPVGMCLYTMSSISKIDIWTLSKELLPYEIGITVVTLICAYSPAIVLWLPNLLK
ncbi:MAG: TRAP transporter large permease [Negativicutes bacterium]